MKRSGCLLALWLVLWSVVWGQEQGQQEPPRQEEPQSQPPQKPTLGKQPERPSLHGQRTSNTVDARRLVRVEKIYVERIDNNLNEKLIEGLAKMGRFRLVGSPNEADAVLRGTCFDSRRLKIVHSEVYLNDRRSGAAIWQDSLRQPFNPPPLDKAVDESARLILAHLRESLQVAAARR